VDRGRHRGLANKECCGGVMFFMQRRRRRGCFVPAISEHNALFRRWVPAIGRTGSASSSLLRRHSDLGGADIEQATLRRL